MDQRLSCFSQLRSMRVGCQSWGERCNDLWGKIFLWKQEKHGGAWRECLPLHFYAQHCILLKLRLLLLWKTIWPGIPCHVFERCLLSFKLYIIYILLKLFLSQVVGDEPGKGGTSLSAMIDGGQPWRRSTIVNFLSFQAMLLKHDLVLQDVWRQLDLHRLAAR